MPPTSRLLALAFAAVASLSCQGSRSNPGAVASTTDPQLPGRLRAANFEVSFDADTVVLQQGATKIAQFAHGRVNDRVCVHPQASFGAIREFDGCAATERWSVHAGLTHVEWAFDAAPAASSEIVVHLKIDDASSASRTSQGVRLRTADGASIAISDATWIDASGRRAPIAARIENGGIEYRLSAKLLAETAWPAWLDPTISAEFPLESPPARAYTTDSLRSLTYGAGTFFGLTDNRYFVRFKADGTPIDLFAASLSDSIYGNALLSAAFDGNSFVSASMTSTGLIARWHAPAGGPASATVTVADAAVAPAGIVLSDGQASLMLWENQTPTYGTLFAQRFDRTGTAIDAVPIDLKTIAEPYAGTWDGTAFIVATINGGVLRVSGTSSAPSVLEHVSYPILGGGLTDHTAAMASDGASGSLFAWIDSGLDLEAKAVRLSRGSPLSFIDTSPIVLGKTDSTFRPPSVAWDGTSYYVAWSHGPLDGIRVGTDGKLGTLTTIVSDGLGAIGAAGSQLVAEWNSLTVPPHGHDTSASGPLFSRLNPSLVKTDPTPTSLFNEAWSAARLTATVDHDNFLAAWWNEGLMQIRGNRYDSSGKAVASSSSVLATTSWSDRPSLAFDGVHRWLVYTSSDGHPVVQQLAADLTPVGRALSGATSADALLVPSTFRCAPSAGCFAMLSSPPPQLPWLVAMGPDGTLGAPVELSINAVGPLLVSNRQLAAVGTTRSGDFVMVRYSRASLAPTETIPLLRGVGFVSAAQIIEHRDGVFVDACVWSASDADWRQGAFWITSSGKVTGPLTLFPGKVCAAALASDGANVVSISAALGAGSDIGAVRVRDGVPADAKPIILGRTGDTSPVEYSIAAVSNLAGDVFVAYARAWPDDPAASLQPMGVIITRPQAAGGACTTDADCATGLTCSSDICTGPADAGVGDGGDAGISDGGASNADSQGEPAGAPTTATSGGCSCAAPPSDRSPPGAALLAALAVTALRRSRRALARPS